MKCVTEEEFMTFFDSTVHDKIREAIKANGATAVVMFENVDFWSSHLGERTAVVTGPTCTYKSPKDCEGKWLNDLPSVRQYPQAYWELVSDA